MIYLKILKKIIGRYLPIIYLYIKKKHCIRTSNYIVFPQIKKSRWEQFDHFPNASKMFLFNYFYYLLLYRLGTVKSSWKKKSWLEFFLFKSWILLDFKIVQNAWFELINNSKIKLWMIRRAKNSRIVPILTIDENFNIKPTGIQLSETLGLAVLYKMNTKLTAMPTMMPNSRPSSSEKTKVVKSGMRSAFLVLHSMRMAWYSSM